MTSTTEANAEKLLGNVIEFDYPHTTDRRVELKRYERRRVLVQAIRDPAAEPLDPTTFQLNPHLARDGLLISGLDLDLGEERSFYTGSMRELRANAKTKFPGLRVFIDDSHGPRTVELPDSREHFARYFRRLNPRATVLAIGRRQPISSATRKATAS